MVSLEFKPLASHTCVDSVDKSPSARTGCGWKKGCKGCFEGLSVYEYGVANEGIDCFGDCETETRQEGETFCNLWALGD